MYQGASFLAEREAVFRASGMQQGLKNVRGLQIRWEGGPAKTAMECAGVDLLLRKSHGSSYKYHAAYSSTADGKGQWHKRWKSNHVECPFV